MSHRAFDFEGLYDNIYKLILLCVLFPSKKWWIIWDNSVLKNKQDYIGLLMITGDWIRNLEWEETKTSAPAVKLLSYW